MAYSCLPINATFSQRSTWRKVTRLQITPTKTLQRNVDFSILETVAEGGVILHLKIPRQLLHLFHTADASVFFAWYDCGRLRFGCQHSRGSPAEDAFLTQDQSKLSRSSFDPDYRPLPEVFEPWAQLWASSEQSAGYGLVSQPDALQEPWMERTFDRDMFDAPSHMAMEGNVPFASATLRGYPASTITSGCHPELDEFPEPWAYDYVPKDSESSQTVHHDIDDTFPEWYNPHETTFSTSAGIIHRSGPSSIRVETDIPKQLSQIPAVLHACQTSLSGFCHWFCSAKTSFVPGTFPADVADPNKSLPQGIARLSDNSVNSPTDFLGSCHSVEEDKAISPCTSADKVCHTELQGTRNDRTDLPPQLHQETRCFSRGQTCLSGIYHLSCQLPTKLSVTPRCPQSLCYSDLPSRSTFDKGYPSLLTSGFSLSPHLQDFVKLYWDRMPEEKPQQSVPFIDMVDVRQFCQRNQIRYMLNPRVHNCDILNQEAKGNTFRDSPLSTFFCHQSGHQHGDACLMGNSSDGPYGCDKHLGCITFRFTQNG